MADVPADAAKFDDGPVPVGWRSAVAMLRSGVAKRDVMHGLRTTLELEDHAAQEAADFAEAWLAAARTGE